LNFVFEPKILALSGCGQPSKKRCLITGQKAKPGGEEKFIFLCYFEVLTCVPPVVEREFFVESVIDPCALHHWAWSG
jgi:hypothetical protein